MFFEKFNRGLKKSLSRRTMRNVLFERLCGSRKQLPIVSVEPGSRLHLGSGSRVIDRWINVDAIGGDYEVDFRRQRLPFHDQSFQCVVSQHVIEHLDIDQELPHLFTEVHRVLEAGGEFWVSAPDIKLICDHYSSGECPEMVDDMKSRHPDFDLGGLPPSQIVNWLFHQGGQHKNLFDFDLLSSLLCSAGFVDIRQVNESMLLSRFTEFPERRDDFISLYVTAKKAE